MFKIAMPRNFKLGDTAPIKINGAPATLTWQDQNTIVINESDTRRILRHSMIGGSDLQNFDCDDGPNSEGPYVLLYDDERGRLFQERFELKDGKWQCHKKRVG